MTVQEIEQHLKTFSLNGPQLLDLDSSKTRTEYIEVTGSSVPRFLNEFWTAKQRQACSIHEISYRACFKPQLPRFFIELLTREGDLVYDPFSGRGTTAIEAGLMGRNVIANDVNPLSRLLARPRFFIPDLQGLEERLNKVPFGTNEADIDLNMFYHPDTESEIVALRRYLLEREKQGTIDELDEWIRMVATNRLTGHSVGFFSVYTLPPNQATSPESQIKINQKRDQKPPYRNTKKIIVQKTLSLIKTITKLEKENLKNSGDKALFLIKDARKTNEIQTGSIKLTVTSPPFLDVVHYAKDNWLRCWFNDINAEVTAKNITMAKTIEEWSAVMGQTFQELYRITADDGWVAFEVGEIRNGSISLDENVVPLGKAAGFKCVGILVNQQIFTKTSNIWGINNNQKGTNTNRVVIFRK